MWNFRAKLPQAPNHDVPWHQGTMNYNVWMFVCRCLILKWDIADMPRRLDGGSYQGLIGFGTRLLRTLNTYTSITLHETQLS